MVWQQGKLLQGGVDVSFQFAHSFKASQCQQLSASWESVLSCSSVSQKEWDLQGRKSSGQSHLAAPQCSYEESRHCGTSCLGHLN